MAAYYKYKIVFQLKELNKNKKVMWALEMQHL